MKRVIRKSVFETNSSSVHAIAISREENYSLPKMVYFRFGRYGWEKEIYSDKTSKASYLWTGICSLYDCDKANEAKAWITSVLNKYNILCEFEVWKETFEWKGKAVPDIDGYIDHSDGLCDFMHDILNDENMLLSFLFSDDSFVETGNDNTYDYPDDYFQVNSDKYDVYTKTN